MVNHFLRYLQAQTETTNDDWLGDSDTPLRGFTWSCDSELDTTGILMWSKPFVIKTKNEKELAILENPYGHTRCFR